MNHINSSINNISRQLRINAFLKGLLVALALCLLLTLVSLPIWLLWIIGLGGFSAASYFFGAFDNKETEAYRVLHRSSSNLEFSLEILNKKSLSLAEQLQLERLNQQAAAVQPPQIWHQRTLPFIAALLFASAAIVLFHQLPTSGTTSQQAEERPSALPGAVDRDVPLEMEKSTVKIQPPAYTGIKASSSRDMNISTIAGSQVTWEMEFNQQENIRVALVNVHGKEIPFNQEGAIFRLKDKIASSGIYSIRAYKGDEEAFQTPFYKIEAIQDKAPVIEPKQKELYTYHSIRDEQTITLGAKVSDDFLVREVYLVATLARGSGENVKFRETRIPFEKQNFKSATLERKIELAKLNFQPGDELYYYWAAADNRQPEPNTSRSETFFIKYRDTTAMSEAELTTMAVQVLPEYFRSQRQIIIDTEKLIAERGKKAEKSFNSTSNEIGYDQKLLRMRYGQYLGEEFESSAGGGDPMADGDGDLLEGFMHKHDQEGEHEHDHHHGHHGHDHGHHHEHNETSPTKDDGGLGNLLENFIHAHEDDEMNTFYEESTRGILKAALENMWQSELHLRLFEPEKALPFQNKALELLKSVQQKSRVYVRRTGFDPPPIREAEKRLTGDLDKIHAQDVKQLEFDREKFSLLAAKVLGILEKDRLEDRDQEIIREFGNLWAERMQTSGLDDWNQLIVLQKLTAGETLNPSQKAKLQQKLLPHVQGQARQASGHRGNKALENYFWKNLP